MRLMIAALALLLMAATAGCDEKTTITEWPGPPTHDPSERYRQWEFFPDEIGPDYFHIKNRRNGLVRSVNTLKQAEHEYLRWKARAPDADLTIQRCSDARGEVVATMNVSHLDEKPCDRLLPYSPFSH